MAPNDAVGPCPTAGQKKGGAGSGGRVSGKKDCGLVKQTRQSRGSMVWELSQKKTSLRRDGWPAGRGDPKWR